MTFIFTPLRDWCWFERASPFLCQAQAWRWGFQIGCVSVARHA
jgi:hypothetical protein